MRPPLRTSGRKNKQSRAINERLETARWRTCPSPAVLTTAHHRMGVASSTRCLVVSSCTSSPHHLHGSSKHRISRSSHTVWSRHASCGCFAARASRRRSNHTEHAEDRLTRVVGDAASNDNSSIKTCRGVRKHAEVQEHYRMSPLLCRHDTSSGTLPSSSRARRVFGLVGSR